MPSFIKLAETFREELPDVLVGSRTLSLFCDLENKSIQFFSLDLRAASAKPGMCALTHKIVSWLAALEAYTQRHTSQLINSEISWRGSDPLEELLYCTWKMNLAKLNADLVVMGSAVAEQIMHRAFLLCTCHCLLSSYETLSLTKEGRFWSARGVRGTGVCDSTLLDLFCEFLTDAQILRVQVFSQHPLRGTVVGEICNDIYNAVWDACLLPPSCSGSTVSPRSLARTTTQKAPESGVRVRFDVPGDDTRVTTAYFSVAEVQELRHQILALYKDPAPLHRIAMAAVKIVDELYNIDPNLSLERISDTHLHQLLLTVYRIRKHAEALNRSLVRAHELGSAENSHSVNRLASDCQKQAHELEACIKQEFIMRLSSEEELLDSSIDSYSEEDFVSVDLSD